MKQERAVWRQTGDDEEEQEEIVQMQQQILAALKIQDAVRGHQVAAAAEGEPKSLTTEREEDEERQDKVHMEEAQEEQPSVAEGELSPEEEPPNPEEAFVIRNLDTGEVTSVALHGREGTSGGELPPTLYSKLSFGALQPHTPAWDAAKADCRGVLEKLASKSTLSFRSYQLCVWQERFVFAEDDALSYHQLGKERQPQGSKKRIPYGSIRFVGPFDQTQFVLMCARRSYTFLCDTEETRPRWIKSISQLAGCSASLEACWATRREVRPERR
jgi:hypothetical protein